MEKLKNLITNKWFKFSIVAILYTLWVIWLDNYWWLLGLIVIFDLYITKKVPWAFWKKIKGRNKFEKKTLEWVDAIIFAVIAASFIRMFFFEAYTIPTSSMEKSLLVGDFLFVSKFHYGPKMPNTPISFPFVHNTLPGSTTKKSFSDIIQWDYRRIAGLGKIKNDDIVVFNFPEGDTVVLEYPAMSYYQIIREHSFQTAYNEKKCFNQETCWEEALKPENLKKSRELIHKYYTIADRPVDKCDNYIKRCIAIPGDTLQIVAGDVFVNNKKQKDIENKQYQYSIETDGSQINKTILEEMGISNEDCPMFTGGNFSMPLTKANSEKIKSLPIVKNINKVEAIDGNWDPNIFPHNKNFKWNLDFYGPIVIPQKGMTIKINKDNLPLYERIIDHYEKNDLQVTDEGIFINGEKTDSYTFKMDYYWMMGDNRHNSLDSRYWGFVPEDHIVGTPVLIWLSLNKDKHFPFNIRWNRMFNIVNND